MLAGVDGLTLDGLIELAHDPYLPGFEALIGGLLEAREQAAEPDAALAEPIAVLEEWDFATGKDSVAMTLAHFYGMNYLARATFPVRAAAHIWCISFGATLAVTEITPWPPIRMSARQVASSPL